MPQPSGRQRGLEATYAGRVRPAVALGSGTPLGAGGHPAGLRAGPSAHTRRVRRGRGVSLPQGTRSRLCLWRAHSEDVVGQRCRSKVVR